VPSVAQALPSTTRGRLVARVAASAGWRDYVTLTKPRIMSLLVLAAVCAMVAAARGSPPPAPLAALVLGGALACGGASALNHVLDRDIDRLMGPRTASRPVAAGRIAPRSAVAFGLVLSVLSFVVLAVFANLLAATLAVTGGLFYVLVYTLLLKRSTPQNIVIGGAAGAIPRSPDPRLFDPAGRGHGRSRLGRDVRRHIPHGRRRAGRLAVRARLAIVA
jgi:heme o synthase